MKSKNLTLASLFAGLFMFMNPMGSEACTRACLPRAGRYGRNRTYHGLERGPAIQPVSLPPGRTEKGSDIR